MSDTTSTKLGKILDDLYELGKREQLLETNDYKVLRQGFVKAIEAYVAQRILDEARWWRYEAQCLSDELWDDKYNTAKVIGEIMDDRIEQLTNNIRGEEQ